MRLCRWVARMRRGKKNFLMTVSKESDRMRGMGSGFRGAYEGKLIH